MHIRNSNGRVIVNTVFVFMLIFMLVPLIWSVFVSGYYFTFFGDELAHAQFTYLIAKGYQPYRDFFMYASSLFNMILVPFFNLAGYSFDGVYRIKIVMIGIFTLRIIAGYLLLHTIQGWHAGILFIFLTLLDPFSVATGMQIRPDNLMYPIYLVGLWLTVRAFRSMHAHGWLLSGMTLSLAILILIKLLPAYLITLGILAIYLVKNKRLNLLGIFLLGSIIPPLLYSIYFIANGTLPEMIRAMTVDAASMTGALWFPTRFGFFYQPNNTVVYGAPGMPASWYLANCMPVAGAVSALILILIPNTKQKRIMRVIIGASIVAQWLFLLSIDSAFAQYYQSLTIFLAIALAMLLGEVLRSLRRYRLWYITSMTFIILLLAVLAVSGIRANYARATMRGEPAFTEYERIWEIVPENEPVFNGFLFRPLASGIPYGLFSPEVPASIRSHYPEPIPVLQEKRIRFLFMSDYELTHTEPTVMQYIRTNYRRHPELENLMIKIDEQP